MHCAFFDYVAIISYSTSDYHARLLFPDATENALLVS